MKLAINQCPTHKLWSISIDDADGNGTRLTPSKCCGHWKVIATWKLSKREWEELAETCHNAAEETAA